MNSDRVVVDANIAFKALVSQRGDLRNRLGPAAGVRFFSPRFLFVELFKHKERLSSATGLGAQELLDALQTLTHRLEFIAEEDIRMGTWMEAHRLCLGLDEADTPYVALTLHLEGRLWTEDRELQSGLRARGFDNFFIP